jgi:O-antigen/teichoic acid export membrane protein
MKRPAAVLHHLVDQQRRLLRRLVPSHRFLQDAGGLSAASFLATAVALAQGILVARWLGPEWYGVAVLILAYPDLVFSLFDAQSSQATVRFLGQFSARGDRERALAICRLGYLVDLAIALVSLTIVAATAAWAARHVVHSASMAPLLMVYAAASLPRSLVGTSRAVLTTLNRFRRLAVLEGSLPLFRLVLITSFLSAGLGVPGLVWGTAIATALHSVMMAIAAHTAVRETWNTSWLTVPLRPLKEHRQEIAHFLFYNDLNVLVGIIVKQFDVIALGYVRGPSEAGYYRLAKSVGGVLGNLTTPLQTVVLPRFVHLFGIGDYARLQSSARHYALQVGLPLGAVVVVCLPLLPPVIHLLVGPAYLPMIVAAQLILARSAIWLALFWLRPLFLALGHVRPWLATRTLAALLYLAGCALVAHRWGYVGIAGVHLISGIAANAVALLYLRTGFARLAIAPPPVTHPPTVAPSLREQRLPASTDAAR